MFKRHGSTQVKLFFFFSFYQNFYKINYFFLEHINFPFPLDSILKLHEIHLFLYILLCFFIINLFFISSHSHNFLYFTEISFIEHTFNSLINSKVLFLSNLPPFVFFKYFLYFSSDILFFYSVFTRVYKNIRVLIINFHIV